MVGYVLRRCKGTRNTVSPITGGLLLERGQHIGPRYQFEILRRRAVHTVLRHEQPGRVIRAKAPKYQRDAIGFFGRPESPGGDPEPAGRFQIGQGVNRIGVVALAGEIEPFKLAA